MNCKYCEGIAVELGTLGWVKHYRCENCGIEFRVNVKPKDKQEQKRKAKWLRVQRREKQRIQTFGYE